MVSKLSSNAEEQQRAYYDGIADEYDKHYAGQQALEYRERVFADFLKGIDLHGKKVLDAMCGGGQNATFFCQRGAHVVGLDISQGQCDHYKRRFPESEVICCSILSNNLSDSSFDFIVSDSLHHLHPDVHECMSQFHRLLKPGGMLMMWEPSAGSVFDICRRVWYRADPKFFQDNEASIDLERLVKDNKTRFSVMRRKYGGNLAYLLLNLSMATRTSASKSALFRRVLMVVEKIIGCLQTKRTALWFLVLFKKE